MGMIGRILEAKNTVSGKIVSILLCVLLAGMAFNAIALSHEDSAFAESVAPASIETTDDGTDPATSNEIIVDGTPVTQQPSAAKKSGDTTTESQQSSNEGKTDSGDTQSNSVVTGDPNSETQGNTQEGNTRISIASESDGPTEEATPNEDINGDGLIVKWDEGTSTLVITGKGVFSDNTAVDSDSSKRVSSIKNNTKHLIITGDYEHAISIPNAYQSSGMFYANNSLLTVEISNAFVGSNEFEWCKKLSSVTLNNSTVNENAFLWMGTENSATSGLVKIINSDVKKNAFSNCGKGWCCYGFRTLEVINSTLESEAFGQYTQCVRNITITDSTLGDGALGNPIWLETVSISGSTINGGFKTRGEYEKCGKSAGYCKNEGNVVSASAIVTIKNSTVNSFGACRVLKEVTINNSTLGDGAFKSCTRLETVNLDNNIGALGKDTFRGCQKLTTINLDNITSIGDYAFSGCSSLESINVDNVQSIGEYAFYNCSGLTSVNLTNAILGYQAFSGCNGLKTVTANNVTMGERAFLKCTQLETVDASNSSIGYLTFWQCSNLKTVTISDTSVDTWAFYGVTNDNIYSTLETVIVKGKSSIGGDAFAYCNNIKTFTIENPEVTKLGYIDVPGTLGDGCVPNITERTIAILKNQFNLDDAEDIQHLTLDPAWTSGKEGMSNNGWNSYDNATQVIEQARWADKDKTVAEVQVDAYYTAQQQMDFIFVLDLSRSMAFLGNSEDMNARFYDMQSKVLDVTSKLLADNAAYDCQVAFATFGDKANQSLAFTKKENRDDALSFVKGLTPMFQATDYGYGLQTAQNLIEAHKAESPNRKTTVIFISDGQPTTNDSGDMYGTKAAGEITNSDDVEIFGVLQSLPANEYEKAKETMNKICTEGKSFTASNTQEFSDAVNNAIEAAYSDYTMTIPVGGDFGTVDKITVDTGTAEYNPDTHEIIWNITGMPFTKHHLTYTVELKDKDSQGSFDVNLDTTLPGATLKNAKGELVNTVVTPVLSRGSEGPGDNPENDPKPPVDPVDPEPNNPDPVNPDPDPDTPDNPTPPTPGDNNPTNPTNPGNQEGNDPAITPATTDETPTAEATAEAAADEAATADIADDENPLAAFDSPSCWVHYWIIMGIIVTAIYSVAVLVHRRKDIHDLDDFEDDVLGNTEGVSATNPVTTGSEVGAF